MPEPYYSTFLVAENALLAAALTARLFKAISTRTMLAVLTLAAGVTAVRHFSTQAWVWGALVTVALAVLSWAWLTEPARQSRQRRAS
ncbi:hypothetical protein AB0I98_16925 [Streptomyces sp. NPDC050211]|uniref:hypothetical protein n=1 Tax=Streptomyces sp. NPDC050211 TaxID=3154932 RepID=UPI003441ACD8